MCGCYFAECDVASPVLPGWASVWVNSDVRNVSLALDVIVDAGGNFTANFAGQFDVQRADQVDVWFHAVDTEHVGATFYLLRPDVNYAHEWVNARTLPNAQVTVSVAGKGSCTGQADGDGQFSGDTTRGIAEASAFCGTTPDDLRKKVCERAVAGENFKFVAQQCPPQAQEIAQRECAGRKYTALMGTKYAEFCSTYAQEMLAGNEAQPAAQPTEEDAKKSAKEKGKKLIKGLFGK